VYAAGYRRLTHVLVYTFSQNKTQDQDDLLIIVIYAQYLNISTQTVVLFTSVDSVNRFSYRINLQGHDSRFGR